MEKYLDLNSEKYKKCNSIQEKFKKLAHIILNRCTLYVNNSEFKIEEIEFYYKSKDHNDTCVHGVDDQLNNGTWYLHKYKNGSYKNGTWKGIDLTFGNRKENIYGGILLRTISSNNNTISGSCNVVNNIMTKLNVDTVNEFGNIVAGKDALDKKTKLYIKKNRDDDDKIYCGIRVGLSFNDLKYTFSEYRFLTNVRDIVKYRNTVISKLFNDNKSIDDIINETKLKKHVIDKAIKEFKSGQELDNFDAKDMNQQQINKIYGWFKRKN